MAAFAHVVSGFGFVSVVTWIFLKPTVLNLAIDSLANLASLWCKLLHVDVEGAVAAGAHSSSRCIVTSTSSNLHIVLICP